MATTRAKKEAPAVIQEPASLTLPRFSSLQRLLIYPAAVIAPGAGLALGVLYFRQDDAEARRFGLICLVLAALGVVARMSRGDFHGMQSLETLTQPFY